MCWHGARPAPCTWPTPTRGCADGRRSSTARTAPERRTSRAPWPSRIWSGSPVVALTSTMRRTERFRKEYQELDQPPLFAPVTKWGVEASIPAHTPRLVREAARQAISGAPGTGVSRDPQRPLRSGAHGPSAAGHRRAADGDAPVAASAEHGGHRGGRPGADDARSGRSSSPATASTSPVPTRPCAWPLSGSASRS